MRFIAVFLLLLSIDCAAASPQRDSLAGKRSRTWVLGSPQQGKMPFLDSVALALANRQQFVEDSVAMVYFKKPDSLHSNSLVKKILGDTSYTISGFFNKRAKSKTFLKEGSARPARDPWIIFVIIGLFIYTALLNLFLNKDIRNVVQSFYNKNAISQVDKEAGLVNSWAFIGLFLLFSLTSGLILYQLTVFSDVHYSVGGFSLFMLLSLVITALFALKFLVLKFLGFVFDINRLVSGYIAILNLTYFNIAFVFLPVAVCFSLLPAPFIPILLEATRLIVVVIFAWQYLRNSVNIISNIRFHKFYLFIYLCALEICPVLILIKALDI